MAIRSSWCRRESPNRLLNFQTGKVGEMHLGGSSAYGAKRYRCYSIAPSRVPAPLAGAEHLVSRGPVHHHRLALVRAAVDRLWCGGGPRHPLLRSSRRRHWRDSWASAGPLPAAPSHGLRQPRPSGTHRGHSHALRLGSLQLWHIYVLALLAGALSPATTAGVRAFVPHLVDDAALDRANALTATSLQFSYLAGPLAAGFAVARLGGPWALFIDAASFLVMGLLVLTMRTITREPRIAQDAAADRWLGFGALFSLRYVPAITLLSLVFFFSYGPLEAALPVYSGQTLHANADSYELLWTGFGMGAFAGVLTLTKLSQRWRPSIALPMIAVLWGTLLSPLLFIRQLPLAMLFLGLAGASWAPYTPMETTLLQRLVPPEIRGQVFGARYSLVVAATPLGAAFGGLLLKYLSAPLVIAISGLSCILVGLGGLASPSLRQLQRGSP